MTTLDRERLVQRAWRLRPDRQNLAPTFEQLVDNEFLTPVKQQQLLNKRVENLLAFCAKQVPYYQSKWSELGIKTSSLREVDDLQRLPILVKQDVKLNSDALQPVQPPRGHEAYVNLRSSGTTGEPLVVAHSRPSRLAFSAFKQRYLRWFGFDPMANYGAIRPASDLPRKPGGQIMGLGETWSADHWPLVGTLFYTGRYRAFDDLNPPEAKLSWLHHHRPDYLLGQAASLEQMAVAGEGRNPFQGIRAFESISQQLLPEMAQRISKVFAAPVYQNYGLNEAGIVAARCPEAGNYHFNAENYAVEIVDAKGTPCAAGERGRLLVTTLGNFAMPLVRYDTDDLAEVAHGPCPCGRTLPHFSDLFGRYRRTACLPEGTWDYWVTFQRGLNRLQPAALNGLLQYQLHHHRDNSFTLRLVLGETFPVEQLENRIRSFWGEHLKEQRASLQIAVVDGIERAQGTKYQNFISDYFPDIATHVAAKTANR